MRSVFSQLTKCVDVLIANRLGQYHSTWSSLSMVLAMNVVYHVKTSFWWHDGNPMNQLTLPFQAHSHVFLVTLWILCSCRVISWDLNCGFWIGNGNIWLLCLCQNGLLGTASLYQDVEQKSKAEHLLALSWNFPLGHAFMIEECLKLVSGSNELLVYEWWIVSDRSCVLIEFNFNILTISFLSAVFWTSYSFPLQVWSIVRMAYYVLTSWIADASDPLPLGIKPRTLSPKKISPWYAHQVFTSMALIPIFQSSCASIIPPSVIEL